MITVTKKMINKLIPGNIRCRIPSLRDVRSGKASLIAYAKINLRTPDHRTGHLYVLATDINRDYRGTDYNQCLLYGYRCWENGERKTTYMTLDYIFSQFDVAEPDDEFEKTPLGDLPDYEINGDIVVETTTEAPLWDR